MANREGFSHALVAFLAENAAILPDCFPDCFSGQFC
jgi:hypothetical protein